MLRETCSGYRPACTDAKYCGNIFPESTGNIFYRNPSARSRTPIILAFLYTPSIPPRALPGRISYSPSIHLKELDWLINYFWMYVAEILLNILWITMWFTSAGTISFSGARGNTSLLPLRFHFQYSQWSLQNLTRNEWVCQNASGTILFCVRGFDRSTRPMGRNHLENTFPIKLYARAWRDHTLYFLFLQIYTGAIVIGEAT